MKLIVAIVHRDDAGRLVDALIKRGYRATRLQSAGGFLRQANGTFLIGVEEDQVPDVLDVVRTTCRARTETLAAKRDGGTTAVPAGGAPVAVGSATVFVLPVDRVERF